jgi:hypothetical protein
MIQYPMPRPPSRTRAFLDFTSISRVWTVIEQPQIRSAVCYGDSDILPILLKAGTDMNSHGEHVPALHVVAATNNMEAAMILILPE